MDRSELALKVFEWFKNNTQFKIPAIWQAIAETDDDSLYEFYLKRVFDDGGVCDEE